jgi:mannose-6-phosphate isomerase-like protein (cupin superfamily)
MIDTIRFLWLTAAVILGSALSTDPAGFARWTSSDLNEREEALSKRVGPDHSARETLAEYEGHRFRMLYRDRDGDPEQHDNEVDVVFVHSGEATLVVGGTMIDRKPGNGAGEYLGTSIEGGDRYPLAAGDLVHIPTGIPHRFLVREGKHVTYVIVKLRAR